MRLSTVFMKQPIFCSVHFELENESQLNSWVKFYQFLQQTPKSKLQTTSIDLKVNCFNYIFGYGRFAITYKWLCLCLNWFSLFGDKLMQSKPIYLHHKFLAEDAVYRLKKMFVVSRTADNQLLGVKFIPSDVYVPLLLLSEIVYTFFYLVSSQPILYFVIIRNSIDETLK